MNDQNQNHDKAKIIEIVEFVTPENAAAYLETRYEDERPARPRIVEQYANQMKEGRWVVTPQAIVFDVNGRLIDGQHRLFAVTKAGIGQDMMVSRGWPTEVRKCLDQGNLRSAADGLRYEHALKDPKTVAGICNVLREAVVKRTDRLTSYEVDDWYRRFCPSFNWLAGAGRPKSVRLRACPITAAFVFAHSAPLYRTATEEAYQMLCRGVFTNEHEPIKILREFVLEASLAKRGMGNREARMTMFLRFCNAIVMTAEREKTDKLPQAKRTAVREILNSTQG